MHNLIGIAGLVVACAALFLLRRGLGLFWSAALFLVAVFVYLRFGVMPPVPGSLVKLFGLTTLVAVLLYATSSEAGRTALWSPLRALMVEPARRPLLVVVLLAVPALVAWQSFSASLPASEAPPLVRSVHPAPPSTISLSTPGMTEAKTVDLIAGDNPLRALKNTDPKKFAEHVAHGKVVYYQNCYYCHGDNLGADGHYAAAMRPPPATFRDPGVLPLLQESFLFWRVAKGGPGLPDEGTPWDSAMPVWEKFLSEEEMWQALLFLYDFTGYEPRAVTQLAPHAGTH